MTISISLHQARVYFVVKSKGPIGPSKIGHALDRKYESASTSVTRPLKRLVALGLVRRVAKNQRVVKFAAISEPPPFEIVADENDPHYVRLRNDENL